MSAGCPVSSTLDSGFGQGPMQKQRRKLGLGAARHGQCFCFNSISPMAPFIAAGSMHIEEACPANPGQVLTVDQEQQQSSQDHFWKQLRRRTALCHRRTTSRPYVVRFSKHCAIVLFTNVYDQALDFLSTCVPFTSHRCCTSVHQ